jgi:hypothetical protein
MFDKQQRRQLFVDTALQTALLTRCLIYWCMALLSVFLALICWEVITGPARPLYTHMDGIWYKYAPVLLFTISLAPIIGFDLLRLSNRFAGPMVRLRRAMRALARGEHIEQVVLRRNDFWREYADDLNGVVVRIKRLETELATLRERAGGSGALSEPAADTSSAPGIAEAAFGAGPALSHLSAAEASGFGPSVGHATGFSDVH